MITIVDYGLGNVRAFLNVYRRLNIEARTATNREELRNASKVILPGVGAFDHAMERLEHSGMRDVLDHLALEQGVPVLGVCVGMQILAEGSDEGVSPGLGWIRGRVRSLGSLVDAAAFPVPHMGWNDVRPLAAGGLFEGLESGARFYFLHSYCLDCERREDEIAVAHYGMAFACAVKSANIYGVQFHPEKSHQWGIRLLKNFGDV